MSPIKLTKLSREQKSLMQLYKDKWIKIGLSTEPANREKTEQAIKQAYKLAGLNPPKKIVWCGSPLSQELVRAIILDKKIIANIGASVKDSVWTSVWDSVWGSVGAGVRDSVRDSVGAGVRDSVKDSVGASVRDSVWGSVGAGVWDSVRDSVGTSVRDSVWASVGAGVWDSVGDSVGAGVWDSVGDSVGASVRDSIWASVRDSIWASVRDSVWDSVRDSVWDSVWASVWDSVRDSVWDSVRDSVGDTVRAIVWGTAYGQHDAHWLAFYEYFKEVCGLKEETQKIDGLIEIAKNAGWFLPHENICWVSEKHCLLNRDEQGRLHSLTEPAVLYPDGWAIYAVHGVRVPEYLIKNPKKITIGKIESEENAEVKRVMIDIYGLDNYIQNCGASLIHKDTLGELYKKEMTNDEDILMVKVINSTAEHDGTFKNYFLRVHPECRPLLDGNKTGESQELTATNAIASTFGLYGHEYILTIET